VSEPGAHPRELISAYLDDELAVEERQAVDRHLALCERCRRDLASLKVLARAVADEPVPDLPPDLAERIGRRIDASALPFPKRRRYLVPASIAATIGAIGLLAVVQWRQRAPEAPAPRPEAVAEGEAGQDRKQDAPAQAPAPRIENKAKEEPERKDVFAPVPPAAPVPAPEPASPPAAKADERSYAADAEALPAPPLERAREVDELSAKSVAGLRSTGSVGGIPNAVLCAERWVDTAVLATWTVSDERSSVLDLEGIARSVGGRVERVDPYPAQLALVVPRARLAETVAALKRHGVTGLDGTITPEEGFDCVRQRVSLTSR
jgi:hypothetical protein